MNPLTALKALAYRVENFNRDPKGNTWGAYMDVIPVSIRMQKDFFKEYIKSPKTVLMGYLICRFTLLDFRFRVKVMKNKSDEFFAVFPATRVSLKNGTVFEQECVFGDPAQKEFFLRWCVQVWLKAFVDGDGVLLPRYLECKENEFHPVKSDFSLAKNERGYLPWSAISNALFTRSTSLEVARRGFDHFNGPAPGPDAGGAEEGESRQGDVEITDDAINRILDEPSK